MGSRDDDALRAAVEAAERVDELRRLWGAPCAEFDAALDVLHATLAALPSSSPPPPAAGDAAAMREAEVDVCVPGPSRDLAMDIYGFMRAAGALPDGGFSVDNFPAFWDSFLRLYFPLPTPSRRALWEAVCANRKKNVWEVHSCEAVEQDEQGPFRFVLCEQITEVEARARVDALNRYGVDPRAMLAAEQPERGEEGA